LTKLKEKNGQAVVYTIELDTALRTAVSHRKGPEGVMEYERFKSHTNQIQELIDIEAATKVGKDKGEDGDQDDKDDNVDNVQTRTSPPAASSSTGRQSEDGGAAAGGLDPAVELNRYAERIVRAHVTLLVEKASETQCVEAFKSCSAVQNVSGDDHKKRVGIHYHVWLSAESITAPHKRNPLSTGAPAEAHSQCHESTHPRAHQRRVHPKQFW
jgi:hypothetical protein